MSLEKKIVEQWNTGTGFEPKPSGGGSGSGGGGFQPKPATGPGGFEPKPGTGTGGFQPKPGTGTGGFQPKPGTGNPSAPTTDPFSCLKKDADLKSSADGKTMIFDSASSKTGSTWTFYSDYKFTYKDKETGQITNGTWECNGTDAYKMKLDDGDSYDSKTLKWAGVPANSSSQNSGSKPTFTNTSLTIEDLKAGKEVSKGMKGAVVGEIQKLLIAAGYKNISKSGNVDNIFGSRTKASVEQFQEKNSLKKDGIVGDETIKALLSATPVSSSSSSEDPNRKPFDPNAEKDNSIPSTDGTLIEKKKVLQESLKKMLRKSLLKYS